MFEVFLEATCCDSVCCSEDALQHEADMSELFVHPAT